MSHPPSTGSAFGWRSAAVGLALSLVVAAYSAYAGLKVGGVYWPIITATLLSLGLLRALGGARPQEVNVAGTAASTGGLLAAGLIFTVPAAWLLELEVAVWEIVFVGLVGGLLGVLFTLPLRVEMIERLALPYPDGTATARVIEAGDEGGRKVATLLASFAAGGLFTLARDLAGWLPAVVSLDSLRARGSRLFSLGSGVSLVALAGGFLIGPRFTGVWFAGAAVSHLALVPALVAWERFDAKAAAVAAVSRPLGIGVIVGSSFAYFLLRGLPSFAPMARRVWRQAAWRRLAATVALAAAALVVAAVLQLPVWLSALAIAGAFFVSYVAARIAGELNIDPMEIFAFALLLMVLFFVRLPPRSAIFFAAVLCLAAGMAGDFMQDLKAGALVGTRPTDQLKAQLASVVVTAVAMGFILTALHDAYGIGTVALPAPQAVALAGLVEAGGIGGALAWGAAGGGLATLLLLRSGQGILPVAFGIGLYAPMELSLPLAVGGLLRLAAERRQRTDSGRLVAAGVIGGEGCAGVALALWSMLR